tara:strand:- start:1895 stop:2212 length:318 start_codon:yes stop_codon:yes gene_type:complete
MIPSIRSLPELIVMTRSGGKVNIINQIDDSNNLTEDSGQRKRYIRSKHEEEIVLPSLPKLNETRWRFNKDRISALQKYRENEKGIKSPYEIKSIKIRDIDKEEAA